MTTPATTPAHKAGVALVPGRYPYRPVCSCGWEGGWGYVADHAARGMAEAHVESVTLTS